MKIGAIILARANFGRWPDKVLYPIAGKPMIEWVIEKGKKLNIDEVIISTTFNDEDRIIRDLSDLYEVSLSCGDPDNRGARYKKVIEDHNLDYIISLSPAIPFFDVKAINEVIDFCRMFPGYRYYTYGDPLHSMTVPCIIKATYVKYNPDEPELFTAWTDESVARYHEWRDMEVRNKYLYNANIAYKLQAIMANRICEHLGHFPESHDEIVRALVEIQG